MKLLAPYQHHSDTSFRAAEKIEPSCGNLEWEVLDFMRRFGGMTDAEMQNLLGMGGSTQRPRRVSLVEKGLVRDSGTKRKTTAGRLATVWEAVI